MNILTFDELLKEVYKCKNNYEVNELLDKYLDDIEYKEKPKKKIKNNKKGNSRK